MYLTVFPAGNEALAKEDRSLHVMSSLLELPERDPARLHSLLPFAM